MRIAALGLPRKKISIRITIVKPSSSVLETVAKGVVDELGSIVNRRDSNAARQTRGVELIYRRL